MPSTKTRHKRKLKTATPESEPRELVGRYMYGGLVQILGARQVAETAGLAADVKDIEKVLITLAGLSRRIDRRAVKARKAEELAAEAGLEGQQ